MWTAALPWVDMFVAEGAIVSREVVLLTNFAAVKCRAVLTIVWKAERWPNQESGALDLLRGCEEKREKQKSMPRSVIYN